MERLSVLDAEFLHLEDGISHMHIAGVSVFEGPAPTVDDLIGLIAGKLHLIPRYRQRVRSVPFELGRPVWIDDPHFTLEYHVRHTALPAPGGDEELWRLVGRLMSQELDRERPLWETWLVEGLAAGRWALVSKIHHCMVDGVSGVDLLGVVLDLEPDAPVPRPVPWSSEPEPSGLVKVLDAWSGLRRDLGDLGRGGLDAARDPLGALRRARRTGSGLVELGRHLGSTTPSSVEGTIGPHRRWAHSTVSLADVKTIKNAFGGTVNDVVLTAISGAYRSLLVRRGEQPDDTVLRTLVPVSVRSDDAHGVLDNRVSAILFELPVDVEDPVVRLHRVRVGMQDLKASPMSEAGATVTRLGDLAPPMLMGTISRATTRVMHLLPQHSVNTVTTNVPGPPVPLYCLGRRMTAHLPYVPISHGVRIGTAILSYDGTVAFGVTGDYDSVPEVDTVAADIALEVAALTERAKTGELAEV